MRLYGKSNHTFPWRFISSPPANDLSEMLRKVASRTWDGDGEEGHGGVGSGGLASGVQG
jgi:hypothetical protein